MNKKKFELVLAAVFFIVGIFLLIFSQRGATGAVTGVIDISSITSMFIGLLLVVSALVLYTYKGLGELVRRTNARPVSQVTKEIYLKEPNKENRVFVIDTSMFKAHPEPKELNPFLKEAEDIYTIPEAFKGMKIDMRQLLNHYHCRILDENFLEKNRELIKKYFTGDEKTEIAEQVLPYLTGEKQAVSMQEMTQVKDKFKRVFGWMKKAGWNEDTAEELSDHFKRDATRFLKSCVVSDADKDLMVTADRELKTKKAVFVCGNDEHIEHAINNYKKENPELGKNLHYVKVFD